MQYRIGNGFDVHRFSAETAAEATIVLGGVRIPHDRGVIAHSDGDAALHALCDAMLGALALGDIGDHFPDSDPKYRDIDSLELLKQVRALLEERGWRLVNADITVAAEAPKLAPHRQAMREAIGAALAVPVDAISVKATTTEKLGFTGRGEGIAAWASVLLEKSSA